MITEDWKMVLPSKQHFKVTFHNITVFTVFLIKALVSRKITFKKEIDETVKI